MEYQNPVFSSGPYSYWFGCGLPEYSTDEIKKVLESFQGLTIFKTLSPGTPTENFSILQGTLNLDPFQKDPDHLS